MEKTLKQLREGARWRADMVDDGDAVNDSLADDYVNEAYHELYDLITDCDDARRFVRNAMNLEQAGKGPSFLLPNDCYRLVGVHTKSGSRWVPAIPADSSEYAELASKQEAFYPPRYFARRNPETGTQILIIFPTPAFGDVAVCYWPTPPTLSKPTDRVNDPASWLEYVMVGAAIRMLNQVERDSTALLKARADLRRRIEKAVTASDFSNPRRIRRLAYRYGFGGSW